jgi:hypothetical protein
MIKTRQYLILIIAHVFLAIIVILLPFLSNLVSILLFVFGFLYIIKTKNQNNQVLILCAYIAGIEVFIRATDGVFFCTNLLNMALLFF